MKFFSCLPPPPSCLRVCIWRDTTAGRHRKVSSLKFLYFDQFEERSKKVDHTRTPYLTPYTFIFSNARVKKVSAGQRHGGAAGAIYELNWNMAREMFMVSIPRWPWKIICFVRDDHKDERVERREKRWWMWENWARYKTKVEKWMRFCFSSIQTFFIFLTPTRKVLWHS